MVNVNVYVAFGIGTVIMSVGGALLAIYLIILLGQLVQIAWIAFSEKFRDICKAESLILEYRKNREKFMEWNRRTTSTEEIDFDYEAEDA